ncbi:CLUMA_CG009755, isoform A [Clunio marinus]|uniref:CLUMA_CG009755, isoform A n=1 Tax=Clunio marinus TaxID=568069 RepID=A0A1J1I7U6_9DIPT|nr:CLUMA_CG009755, isoform A [Clunio marinus]
MNRFRNVDSRLNIQIQIEIGFVKLNKLEYAELHSFMTLFADCRDLVNFQFNIHRYKTRPQQKLVDGHDA